MSEKTLVIGAAGHVCLETVRIMLDRGANIRIAVKNPEKAKEMDLQGAEFVKFDYCHPETYDVLFDGIDNWMLVSPPTHLELQDKVLEVIDHAKNCGIKYIVNVSEFHTYHQFHPMQVIEDYIESSGIDYTILRTNCFMQYFSSYFRDSINKNHELHIPAGNARTSFIDMRDVAEIAANLLTVEKIPNRIFTLTGEQAFSIKEIADVFTKELNTEVIYSEVDDDEFKNQLKTEGWLEPSINASMAICQYVRQGWNEVITDDAVKLLGHPTTPFKQFVDDNIELWQDSNLDQ